MQFLFPDFEEFPALSEADEDGLLAIGGNLAPKTLLKAYRQGIFPWYNEGEPICWYAPQKRCVIFPEKIKVSKSMKALMKKQAFHITFNKAFDAVIAACAQIERKEQDGTWIIPEMQAAYIKMHQLGYAQSIEVWESDTLVGGLYGISLGKIFCGESMFSKVANASKLALIYLCQSEKYHLIDCQVSNEHLLSMGAELLERDEFMKLLH